MKKLFLSLSFATMSLMVANAQDIQWGIKGGTNFSHSTIGIDAISSKIKTGTTTGFYLGAINNINLNKRWSIQSELTFNMGGSQTVVDDSLFGALESFGVDLSHMTSNLDLNEKLKISYKTYNLQLPVMMKLKTSEGINFMAGPYISARLGSSLEFNDAMQDLFENEMFESDDAYIEYFLSMLPDGYVTIGTTSTYVDGAMDYLNDVASKLTRTVDVGLAFGIEYEFRSGFFFEGRYNLGLLNLMRNEIDGSLLQSGEDLDYKTILGISPTIRNQYFQVGIGYRF